MKSFQNITLKRSYDSGIDDILWDFYIPALSMANRYDRIAGFFSSSVLAFAARGMAAFIENKGTMRLVTCPRLNKSDVEILEKTPQQLDQIISEQFIKEFTGIESAFQRDHVKALGWLLATGRLDMKIAVIRQNGKILDEEGINASGIMHQKVGIMYDQAGNVISFSGSNNESASGWLENTEEFKVFRSWTGGEPFYEDDIAKFESFWTGSRPDVEIKTIPQAIKEKLIEISSDFSPSLIEIQRYYKKPESKEKKPLKPFFYQNEAIQKWESNNRRLLLQMCTGSGKTITAIGCINKAISSTKKLLVVISTPQTTLSGQWKSEIEKYDVPSKYSIELNGGISGWDDAFKKELIKLNSGYYQYLIVYTTHNISSSEKFLSELKKYDGKITSFLVGDEVHGLGAPAMQNALIDSYTYRLGLSATPQRWFDDPGSDLIQNYFGNDSYEFTIHDALTEFNPITRKHYLVKYEYHPRFICLTDEELERYQELTKRIIRLRRYGSDQKSKAWNHLQNMLFARADIEKNAQNKYPELEKILDEIGPEIRNTIIFVSNDQIDHVVKTLGNRGIAASRFTEKQGTVPQNRFDGLSERDYIIKLFKEEKYKVLVAIKCLDEGIDIPSADTAIIMASSTNPREYVQRVGRVIRQAEGKADATIYDMIIKPNLLAFKEEKLAELERRIFKKEMDRVEDISKEAINNVSVLKQIYGVMEEVLK